MTTCLRGHKAWIFALIFALGLLPLLATGRKQIVQAALTIAQADFNALRAAWHSPYAGEDASLFDVEAGKLVHRRGIAAYAMTEAFINSQNLYTGTVVAAWPARPDAQATMRLRLPGEAEAPCREVARTATAVLDDCR